MIDLVATLDYDEREVFWQVMLEALREMTAMQRQCLLLSLCGLLQKQIAQILGVSRVAVSQHFRMALEEVEVAADEFV